jgi:hypothetical protein
MESTTLSALRDLAAGRGVKRGRHALTVDGEEHRGVFLEALRLEGFEAVRVRDVDVDPGERVPAFLVRGDHADFGWVFWEKFTDRRSRKLFGSVVRDEKGDWKIQLGAGSRECVFARVAGRMKVDSDRPSSLG